MIPPCVPRNRRDTSSGHGSTRFRIKIMYWQMRKASLSVMDKRNISKKKLPAANFFFKTRNLFSKFSQKVFTSVRMNADPAP